ncbi:hypothetical protein C8R48DRAFT_782390 [Suillus tomentosus]|nr:hypothetical protein C8R48DRAFT_782390 [Suillus tomentosus]
MSATDRATAANQSFRNLADKIEHIVGQALQLRPAHPKHLSLATHMGQAITEVVMTHGDWVTVLSPLVLSAAAELQEHVDGDNTGISSAPDWSPSPPRAGPSQPRSVIPAVPAEERGRGTQRGKRARAASSCSRSRPPMSKKQRGKSKAIISSNDELDEEELAPMASKPAIPNRPARRTLPYVEVTSEDDMDADEEPTIKAMPKMSTTKVMKNPSDVVLTEDDFTDPSALTWAPRCGQCVSHDLICRQGVNRNNGRALKVCAFCHRLKIQCGGKGSAVPPAKGKSSAARRGRSQSRGRPSPMHDDPAPQASTLVEEKPARPTTPAAPIAEPAETQEDPVAAGPSSILPPTCIAHEEEMQVLKTEVATLRATVEALLAQVVAGDQQLQAAQRRLDAQADRTDQLTGDLADINRILQPPSSIFPEDSTADVAAVEDAGELAAGPVNSVDDDSCLPVPMKSPEVEESNACDELAV